jgi:hypothetical protein
MTKCEFLGKKNFGKILKFFIAPKNQLESLNLNNFGLYSKNKKITIKSLKISKFLALKEFHFLSVEFELEDLLKLLGTSVCHSLNTISITVTDKHIIQPEQLNNFQFEGSNKLECINIEFRTNPRDTFYQKLINSSLNLKRLQISWIREQHHNQRFFLFSAAHYSNLFLKLENLIFGENIRLAQENNYDIKSNLNLLKRLKFFKVNADLNHISPLSNDEEGEKEKLMFYLTLIEYAKRVNLFITKGSVDYNSQIINKIRTNFGFIFCLGDFFKVEEARVTPLYFWKNFTEKIFKLNFVNKYFQSMIIIDSFDFININGAKNLVELDLSHVHIHLYKSNIGSDLANISRE